MSDPTEAARERLSRLHGLIDEGGMLSAIDEVYEGDSMSLRCPHWEEKFAPDLLTILAAHTTDQARIKELENQVADLQEGISLAQNHNQGPFLAWRNAKILAAFEAERKKLRSMSPHNAKAYIRARFPEMAAVLCGEEPD